MTSNSQDVPFSFLKSLEIFNFSKIEFVALGSTIHNSSSSGLSSTDIYMYSKENKYYKWIIQEYDNIYILNIKYDILQYEQLDTNLM